MALLWSSAIPPTSADNSDACETILPDFYWDILFNLLESQYPSYTLLRKRTARKVVLDIIYQKCQEKGLL